jgi:cysteine-rich repeat protein
MPLIMDKAVILPRLIFFLFCSFVANHVHSAKCPHTWPPKRTPQYPFGKREANETVQQLDEATVEVHVPGTGFRFYESNFNNVFVHLDGIITFGTRQAPVRAMGFPHPDIPAITPLWVDVDTRRSGRLYVQSSVSEALLERVTKDIRRGFSNIASTFTSSFALVATWDKVGSFDKNGAKTNNFQCVLATNGTASFALFIYYHKGSLQWSAGDADPERSYTIGANAGDGVRYTSLHEEVTSITSLASLSQQSNIEINGMWILRIDSLHAKVPDWKEFDECATEPCKNNGLCKSDRQQDRVVFTCSCMKGFTGSCCEQEENECSSNPCLNGGHCIDLPGSFECNCSLGYSGVLCEIMACGNGVVEEGEECDDGNKNVWDGCSDTCQVERFWNCSNKVGKLSSCHIKPIDLDKLNPNTTHRNIVYWNSTQSVFIADPAELDCGGIHSKDWEMVDITLTNQMNETEQVC